MPVTDYESFVAYFRNLADVNVALQDFVVGNSERILNRETSIINYPILWLEVPEIGIYQRGGYKERYSSAFLVLKNAPGDDWTQEETDLKETQAIVRQILVRMQDDAETGLFDFDINGCTIMHKGKWSGDNDWGWRVEFELTIDITDCTDDDDWSDLPPEE